MTQEKMDVCVIGGAGHVGLPLGVVLANVGLKTVLFDINKDSLEKIKTGVFPFTEMGGDEALRSALQLGTLFTDDTSEAIRRSRFVIIVVGTPIDEYLSPQFNSIARAIDRYIDDFQDGQIVILRSTVYPGTTEKIQNYFLEKKKRVHVAFCPERITQSFAIEELQRLPQIVSAFDADTLREVSNLFRKITRAEIIPAQPMEAELTKLFTNSWRYIKFAVANQFFMIAQDNGLDYAKIEKAMKDDYARNKDLPSPGFAAGPCLLKDTMQLAAFANNSFLLGHAAMLVNEGLVNHVIRNLRREYSSGLKDKVLGILGMAFKADVDDPRDSLSYKLRKIGQVECKHVLCTDPHIKDLSFVSMDDVLQHADIVVLATPHRAYTELRPKEYPKIRFIDVWNVWCER